MLETGRYIEVSDEDIERAANLLLRWAGPERCSSLLIAREFVAELAATVCPALESIGLESFLRHDRSFYSFEEL